MNQTEAQTITLWCAVLAKAGRGIERRLPDRCQTLHFRMLLQLTRPETGQLSAMQFARVLMVKPDDTAAALEYLRTTSYLRPAKEDGAYGIAQEGRAYIAQSADSIERFMGASQDGLDESDALVYRAMYYDAIVKPGSFFAAHAILPERGTRLPLPYEITAIWALTQAVSATTKRSADLSFTDYRFLLELLPKKRNAAKQLRARDMVRLLRVGRAYVTTASYRLEERGLIERIPEPDDARGILFALTPHGRQVVGDVGEDVYAVYAGLFGQAHYDSVRRIRNLGAVLQGFDRCWENL